MCRWLGSQFHDWIDCNGVAFSIELLESRGRTFSDFWRRKFLCSLGIFSSLIYYNQIAFIHIKNSIITFPFEEECFYFNSLWLNLKHARTGLPLKANYLFFFFFLMVGPDNASTAKRNWHCEENDMYFTVQSWYYLTVQIKQGLEGRGRSWSQIPTLVFTASEILGSRSVFLLSKKHTLKKTNFTTKAYKCKI